MSTQSLLQPRFCGSLTFQLVYLRGLLSVQKKLPSTCLSLNPIQKLVLFSRSKVVKNACSYLQNEKWPLSSFRQSVRNQISYNLKQFDFVFFWSWYHNENEPKEIRIWTKNKFKPLHARFLLDMKNITDLTHTYKISTVKFFVAVKLNRDLCNVLFAFCF